MSNSQDNYTLLIQKLDQFIRKHYINQFLRGLIYSVTIILAFFLLINLIEYFSYLSVVARKIVFYGFVLGSGAIIYKFIVQPLFHYYQLGKIISHEQAAIIIGKHFTNVQDKLLNILQLKKQITPSASDLISASIDQKIENLKPVPFSTAINLGDNKKYLRYLIVPLLALVVILFASPNIIKDGSTRLFYNNMDFERPAPFTFQVENSKLQVVQFQDFQLQVSVNGEVLPENVFIQQDGYSYKMNKKSSTNYEYTFTNLQHNVHFKISAAGYDSRQYEINVLPKPMIVHFDVFMDYPEYTGKKDEPLKNIGDLTAPIGTKVRWEFSTKSTESITVDIGGETVEANRQGETLFVLARELMESDYYTIKVSNKQLLNADSISYSISVIPDLHPSISVKPMEDTVSNKYLYFLGELSDDYGLTALRLKYKVEGSDKDYKSVPIPFDRSSRYSFFSHYWDLQDLELSPGDNISYFFEVWDNDRINGSKSTKSTVLQFKLPSLDEIDKETKESNENIKDKLDSSINQAKEIKEELKALQDKLFQKKSLSWEDKKSIEDLLNKQKDLDENVKDLQQEFSNNLEKQREFKNVNEEILKKQQKLQELFSEVMTDEMKELFEKLESLMENLDQEEILENLENFEFSEEQLEQELDRMLSLFKQLEFEQKLSETIDKLQQLSKEQEELSKETKEETKDNEQLAKEQEDINQKFDNLKEELKELEDINKELGDQNSFNETKEKAEQTKEDLKKSSESLSQEKNKKASESQKDAAKKMQEMSDQLAQMMNDMQMEQMELDLAAIRQILENLIKLSFDEEDLMERIGNASINDPDYVRLVQEQYKIKDDAEMVKDSLYALSKRVFQIESFINKEISDINKYLERSIRNLEDRSKAEANKYQQYVMTGFNNLALMLSETMEAMQQQMASQMPGAQNCQKNGGKSMPSPGMGELQKQLNDQISKLQEQSQKGEQPGGKGGMSKALAEMAAKQAAIREALRKMNQDENSDGSLGDLKEVMDQMDKTETELVNRQLTTEMVKRQKEIQTRLLEAEEALRNRELDKKRESETADEIARKIPPSIEEYLKSRDAEIQLYKTVPPALKPYYKHLIETYFKSISF